MCSNSHPPVLKVSHYIVYGCCTDNRTVFAAVPDRTALFAKFSLYVYQFITRNGKAWQIGKLVLLKIY